ncbi:sensor histidine kinase [Sphingobacterium sp. LRF_L2]|uniref:sensor histidine kinase n=1 Tax=Sphingobacterium sp. LRF_L2 TaxID=3369421 RepID=UPI003F606239
MKFGKLIIQNIWWREILLFLFLLVVTLLNEREDFSNDHGWIDGLFVFLLLYFHLQAHRFFILPLLQRRRYILYGASTLGLIVLFTCLALFCDFYLTNVGWFDEIQHSKIYLSKFYVFSFSMTVPLLIAIHSLFQQYEEQIKREKEKVLLRDMELNMLKGHSNPHFLFNALNSLYGLSLEKSEEVPDKILQMSDILRYQIKLGRLEWISLKDEVDFIQQYLSFESDRQKNYVNVQSNFALDSEDLSCKIAPLLLIFFIENAFKHVRKSSLGCFVNLDLSVKKNILLLSLENSYKEELEHPNSLYTGMENVRRRLSLIYPKKFNLTIRSNGAVYTILLRLHLRK